ncbi:MAG: cytochrome c oxidase assembly protein [Acidobacteriota bacterium]|nr:cytochrome c oxidase assembly protein [Acidobacteriota bacterium]MDE3169819.1 cytochrome c oxidase assembly protein [Acidobacteriota bacterium]
MTLSPQQAILASWSFPPWVTALDLLAVLLYVRGWLVLRRVVPSRFPAWRMLSFTGGIAALQIALCSPIDALDSFSLTDHMSQHMILMMVVPPLVLLGNPMLPLFRGLPRPFARRVLAPVLRWPPVLRFFRRITHPAFCWLALSTAMLGWHLPGPYDLALRSDGWHELEHATFLIASILFWWPVVQPWPSRVRWPRWTVPVYLILADFVNTIVSAFLVFSGRILYAPYLTFPRLGTLSAISDQVLAGVVMWFVGGFAFVLPAIFMLAKLLAPQRGTHVPARHGPRMPESRFRRLAFSALILILPLGVLAYGYLAPSGIDTDGNVVRIQQISGPFRITVLTEPDPLSAGPCDVSVLVQDRDTGEPIVGAPIRLAIEDPSVPNHPPTAMPATSQTSSLKLLESGRINLPHRGDWSLRVFVGRGAGSAEVHANLNATARD